MSKLTPEAKTAIAMAFEGAGGLEKLISWARTHPMDFYVHLYSKLIPVTLNADVHTTVESDATAVHALESALLRMIAARKSERGAVFVDGERLEDAPTNIVIKHEPQAVDGRSHTADGRPQTHAATAAPRAETCVIEHEFTAGDGRRDPRDSGSTDNVQTPRAAVPAQEPRAAVPAQEPRREPTATELFYEYHGTRRLWWGPVGGSPP